MKKRFLAMLMAVVMLIGIIPTGVVAEDTGASDEIAYGNYVDGTWAETGDSSVTYDGITLSKNAVRKDENTYEVTLRVETSTTTSTKAASAATVLVIDSSGSMAYCADCGAENWHGWDSDCPQKNKNSGNWTTRMAAAKSAAISFLDSYKDAPKGRWVAVVDFDSAARVACNWVDVTTDDGYAKALAAINGMGASGGTNLDDGLYNANSLFGSSEVSGIKNKFTVALTDGAPTKSRKNGDGTYGSSAINSDTAATAGTLRNNSKLYTVCFGVANDPTYEGWFGPDGPTVGNFLRDSIATVEEGKKYAYDADNASELYAAFAAITEDITSGLALSGTNVTDPMGDEVGTVTVSGVAQMTDGKGFTWTLGDADQTIPSTDGDGNKVMTYVYIKEYTVTLGANGTEPTADGYFPLNEETYLTLEDGTVLQFPVPAVRPVYTVIYDNGEHGDLADQDENGQVVSSPLVRYAETPAAPEVTPKDGYYFTGWDKEIAPTVTASVTYTAQYAPKTAVTITGDNDTVKYDGHEYTVTTYSDDLPEGYTLEGVKYVAKGTDAGTYTGSFEGTEVIIRDENKKDVTNRFIVTLKPGVLTVEPRNVTLTSADDSKVYDGKALTNETITVGGDGFVEGEGATYNVTGTQTVVGSSVNEFTYTLNEGTKAANYNITQNKGTLTVTGVTDKVTVTIKENGGSEKYDGTEKTVTGYTVSISNPLYTENDFTFSGDATVKGTDAGTYEMKLNASDFTNTSKNFTNVEFVIVDGTLTIDPAEVTVTITGNQDSKVYDGSEKTVTGYTTTDNSTLYSEADFTFSGNAAVKGTDVGTYPMGLAVDQFTNNNNNFKVTFKVTDGQLKITPVTDKVTVTITEHSGSEKYDGTEKAVQGYDVSIDNDLYTENDFTFNGDATVKGTNAGTYPMELKAADFTNTNKNFSNVEFVIVDGTLTITRARVIVEITGNKDTKVYNSNEQEVAGYTVSINNPLYTEKDFTFDNEAIAKGTDVGTYYMGLSQNDFTNNNDNFMVAVNVNDGKLEITPVTDEVVVTIKGNTDTLTYNGGEQSVSNYQVDISNPLYTKADFAFSGDATAKGTDVGEYPMDLTAEQFANTSTNFTNVKFVVEDGNLKIVPEVVTVTIAGNTKTLTYNGGEQSVSGYKVTNISNTLYTESDFAFSGEAIAKGTNVGEYPMGLTVNQFSNKNDNFKVTFDVTDGQLKITPVTDKVTVTITEHSGSEKYDGTEKAVQGYDVSIDNDLYTENDFTFNGDATVKGTDAGTYNMELKAEDFTNTSDNFTNVEFVIVDGTLEIAKRTVTLTSASATKQYDRTALTKEEVTVSGDGFAEGEDATYSNFASITNVGTVDNEFTYTLNEGTKAENYVIEQKFGRLIVSKADAITVIITENNGEYTYDGTEKVVEGYTVALPENAPYTEEDFKFVGEANKTIVKGTYAGTYNMELVPEDFENTNTNFTSVEFVIFDGALVIKPIETVIDITADSNEKVYDGTPLTDDGYTFTENVLVEGDELVVVVEGTITDAGTVENKIVSYQVLRTVADQRATVDVKECYTFGEIVNGTLTVTPRDVIITSGSDTKVYDGTALTNYDITAEGFVEGEGAMVTFTGSQLNAGTSENTFTYVFAENTKAENYTVIIVNGKLEVTPKAVTITSGSATKNYDGEPLTCDKIVAEGFVEGEGAEYTITGSQTEVGTGKNTFTYKLNKNTLAENYVITLVEGNLVVEPPIEIPDTGDNTNLVLYASLMVTSAAAFVSMLVLGKKKGKFTA